MKKLTSLILISVFLLAGCKSAPNNTEQASTENNAQNKEINTKEEAPTEKTNKMCDWVDESDVIIQLILPEEYANAISYEAGFLFESSYGDNARLMRLARKNCDYRVGFSKEDFLNINMSANSPFVIAAENDVSSHFSYEGWPININFDENGTITDGMPEEGKTIIIKVTGTENAYQQYKEIFD